MKDFIIKLILFISIIIAVGLLLGYPLKWLWNWLMPYLFGLKEIDFWQAVGIILLSSILFKKSSSSNDK